MLFYKKRGLFWPVILRGIIFGAVLLLLGRFASYAGGQAGVEGALAAKRAIERAALQCYALEGAYPDSVKYLEDNYGVVINHDRLVVHYDAFAVNLRPDVEVFLIN